MLQEPAALRLSDPGIRRLFTEEARFQSWLDVEAVLAQAQADLGIIPRSAANEITSKADLSLLDMKSIHQGMVKTGHPLVPLVWELDRVCDAASGGYIHWGATTQNITQTGKLLMLKNAHQIYLSQLGQILNILADIAENTKDYVLPGRTHGQHAVPATFGYKVAVWIDEICRHVERLEGCEDRVFVTMLGGGAGTLASLGEIGLEVQELMALKLNMRPMRMPARTIADHLCEYVTLLGMLASTCSKIAGEVYTLMKQEFGEVEEPMPAGTVGSSTMPQKRNPKLAQDIIAIAAQIRTLVPLALEAMITEHEANRTTSVMMDHALTQSATLTGDLLQYIISLFSGIKIFPHRMRANLDLSGGLIMSEAIMLNLGHKLGRQRAHDAVYDAAQASIIESKPFRETLAEVKEINSNLSSEEIEELLDPTKYIGACVVLSLREASRARKVADSINVC